MHFFSSQVLSEDVTRYSKLTYENLSLYIRGIIRKIQIYYTHFFKCNIKFDEAKIYKKHIHN